MAYPLFVMVALLAACSTVQVGVDYDPAANFRTLRSYDWSSTPQVNAGDPLVDTDTLLRQRVISAVNGTLLRKGYRHSPRSPDFLISFYFTRERNPGTVGYPYPPNYGGFFGGPFYGYWGGWYYPGYGGYGGYGSYSRPYDESLLVIDFLEPLHRKLLWRGMIRDFVRFKDTPETRDLRINEAVTAALQRFPPP